MGNPHLEAVRAARRRLEAEGPPRTRAYDDDFERVTLPASEADLVRDALVAEGAGTVIEIGLAYGSSALAIGEALLTTAGTDAHHIIIDPFQDSEFTGAGWQVVVDAGLEPTTSLVQERSQLVLPGLVADGYVADAAFVDGSHHFHNVFVDLYYLGEVVRPGGLLLLDDYPWPSVQAAATYVERNLGWEPLDPPPGGWGRLRVLRLPERPVERPFTDFVAFC